jgi:two-component system, NarL family, response regulator NreC
VNEVKILIADATEWYRRRLHSVLTKQTHWKVVGEASTEEDLLALTAKTKPDVVLVDVSAEVLGGLAAAKKVLSVEPRARIVALSVEEEQEWIRLAFQAGVRGYVSKVEFCTQIVPAIQTVCEGRRFLDGRVSEAVIRSCWEPRQSIAAAQVGQHRLTGRELEVVRLLALGSGNRSIALELGIRLRTVETHRANIMRKLNLHTLAQLIHYAILTEIIHLPVLEIPAAETRA